VCPDIAQYKHCRPYILSLCAVLCARLLHCMLSLRFVNGLIKTLFVFVCLFLTQNTHTHTHTHTNCGLFYSGSTTVVGNNSVLADSPLDPSTLITLRTLSSRYAASRYPCHALQPAAVYRKPQQQRDSWHRHGNRHS